MKRGLMVMKSAAGAKQINSQPKCAKSPYPLRFLVIKYFNTLIKYAKFWRKLKTFERVDTSS